MVPRLKEEYKQRVVGAMTEEFSYRNLMEVPKLQKIVISRGVGAAVADKKLVEHAIEELTLISGQFFNGILYHFFFCFSSSNSPTDHYL